MTHTLGLDQGTTSSRAIVFDAGGRPVGAAQREVQCALPKPGWVEQDPRELWSTLAASAEAALREAGLGARDVSAIGLTNQRETVVLWDRATGDPVCDAIVWQDRRTAGACAQLKADGAEAMVRRMTGLLLDPYFSATKLAWMLEHHKGLRARAEAGELAFGTVDAWVLFNLTGGQVHATDPSNASRTLLFNIHELRWDDELLELFGVPRPLLPEVRPTMGDFGVCARPGALKGLPIRAILGDQQSALYGQGCHEPGAAKNTYGTGCFLLMHTGAEAATSDRLLSSVAWTGGDDPAAYCIEGSVFTAGAAINWLRDGLGLIRDAAEVNRLAASVDDSGGVVFVPALAGLGAPHWDPDARGSITGLTRGTTAAHLARATLEGIAHQVADLVGEMESATGARIESLRVDGGAAASDLLMQIQADILRRPVVRPAMLETTAFGAASAASGLRMPEAGADVFEPRSSDSEARAQEDRWRAAVAACLTASGGR